MNDKQLEGLKLLRGPFEAHQISKLPKPKSKDASKGWCDECNSYHGLPAVHLDYVGHAATTDRLLEADLAWSWEPMSFGPDGLPALDKSGGLWIRLTVNGVTRPGYGSAEGKTGGNAVKELIGDAIRNAAMRFGVALELWHKGILHKIDFDQHGDDEPAPAPEPQKLMVCSPERFAENKESWREIVKSKKKTPAKLIAFLSTKMELTEDQKLTIDSWAHEND